MNDDTIIAVVLAATLATFMLMAVQLKASRTRHQHSLGDMYRPSPKVQIPPPAPE